MVRDRSLRRRAFLAAVSTGATTGVAGCGVGGDGPTGDGDGDGGGSDGPSAADPTVGADGVGRYDVALPGERPALWTHVPHRRIWNKGIVAYVPPDER